MTSIERWMRGIFENDEDPRATLHYFPEIISKFSGEVVKPEHIFLHLFNKGLITGHRKLIQDKKESFEAGMFNVSFNSVRFYITEEGFKFLQLIEEYEDMGIKPNSENLNNCVQLEFDFDIQTNADGTPKSLNSDNGLASQL